MFVETAGIDLTRMECKEERAPWKKRPDLCIDLTRMECKVYGWVSVW